MGAFLAVLKETSLLGIVVIQSTNSVCVYLYACRVYFLTTMMRLTARREAVTIKSCGISPERLSGPKWVAVWLFRCTRTTAQKRS
jgi:hypothetical protein